VQVYWAYTTLSVGSSEKKTCNHIHDDVHVEEAMVMMVMMVMMIMMIQRTLQYICIKCNQD